MHTRWLPLPALWILAACPFNPAKTPEDYFPPTSGAEGTFNSTASTEAPTTTTTESTTTSTTEDTTTSETTTSPPPDDLKVDCPSLPVGVVGVQYNEPFSVTGGVPPYTWQAIALPPGLMVIAFEMGTSAAIQGEPTMAGEFPATLEVRDAEDRKLTVECGAITIEEVPQLNQDELFDSFGLGCVLLGVPLDELLSLGIFGDADVDGWTCALLPGPGNGSDDFDLDPGTPDTFPPGITLDADTCTVGGAVDPTLPLGIYTFIATFTRNGADVHVPYCGFQGNPLPGAYSIVRENDGSDSTFEPVDLLFMPGEPIIYGNESPDPQVVVTYEETCPGSCFYGIHAGYNTLGGGAVSVNPDQKFPAQGFEGFIHAIRIAESDPAVLDAFAGRAWVVNVTFEYCIAGNLVDCGNSEPDPELRLGLIRANGDGSSYRFGMILLPE
jgi:hypothetical protein